MNLREEILKEHSKAQCDTIVAWIGKDKRRFKKLFDLFLNDEYRVVQRSAWPLAYCVLAHLPLIQPYFNELLENLQKPHLHNAVKRNTVRLLQAIDIPEEVQGRVMDICFRYIESPTEAVAVKAFSLTILGKFAQSYPDIIPEIKLLIDDQLPHQTAAFKSRAKALLKQFS